MSADLEPILDEFIKMENETRYGNNITQMKITPQLKELHTIIRDKSVSRSDFVFYANRLIRLVVEEGLNLLPYSPCKVITPTGCEYDGLEYVKGTCGVSIMRSGEAMEKGLRDCCRSIRIGKILIQTDEDTNDAKVFYAKFPHDVHKRIVLLMYPVMSSGNTITKALHVLEEHGVQEENIIILNLFCTSKGLNSVLQEFPKLKILTSDISETTPNHFGKRYFGTD